MSNVHNHIQIWILVFSILFVLTLSSTVKRVIDHRHTVEQIAFLREQNIRIGIELLKKRQEANYKSTLVFNELKRKEDFSQVHQGERVYFIVVNKENKGPVQINAVNQAKLKIENLTVPARWWFYFTR